MYAINQKKIQQEIINNMFKINKGDYTRVDKDNSIFTYVMINTHSIFKIFNFLPGRPGRRFRDPVQDRRLRPGHGL